MGNIMDYIWQVLLALITTICQCLIQDFLTERKKKGDHYRAVADAAAFCLRRQVLADVGKMPFFVRKKVCVKKLKSF